MKHRRDVLEIAKEYVEYAEKYKMRSDV